MKIVNRWNGCSIFENADDNVRDTVLAAIESGANLRGSDLGGSDLSGANLRGADLGGSDLSGANLSGANLRGSDLGGANLREANLRGADLREANLRGADLRGADLSGANLSGANLRGSDLGGANLREANLRGADLREANLRGADLRGAEELNPLIAAQLSIVPAGKIIGWKKCQHGAIVKLEIGAKVKRSNATSRKCRAESAKVLEIYSFSGQQIKEAASQYSADFVYRVGETVSVPDFDTDRWNECAPGIHFFITREEAEAY